MTVVNLLLFLFVVIAGVSFSYHRKTYSHGLTLKYIAFVTALFLYGLWLVVLGFVTSMQLLWGLMQ